MGIERGNELFGGPRVQTGNAGANPVLLIHMSRIISHKLSTLPRSLFLSYALIASYPKVYSEVSLRDLEEEDSQLLGESWDNGCFWQIMRWLALYLVSSVEDPWKSLLSWLKRDFSVLWMWAMFNLQGHGVLSLLTCFQTHIFIA